MKGDLTSRDIASYLSKHLPESEDDIESALRVGCLQMNLNPVVYHFALEQRKVCRKTALVTANMDLFSEVVVPAHHLDDMFDIVLNTAELGENGILPMPYGGVHPKYYRTHT